MFQFLLCFITVHFEAKMFVAFFSQIKYSDYVRSGDFRKLFQKKLFQDCVIVCFPLFSGIVEMVNSL
jgi:hypothetical protein